MMTNDEPSAERRAGRLTALLERGDITNEAYLAAEEAASARGIELETILIREQGVSRYAVLQALSEHYKLAFIEYDERLPVPPDLLTGFGAEVLSSREWFPVIQEGNKVIIAVSNSAYPVISDRLKTSVKAGGYEFRVALSEDIQWFIQDFLNEKPGYIVGTAEDQPCILAEHYGSLEDKTCMLQD